MVKRILIILALVAIILSISTIIGRAQHEFINKNVQYGIFNNELDWLAASKGISGEVLYQELAKMGIDTVVYREDTIQSLREKGSVMVYTGWQIIDMERYFVIADKRIREMIGEGFDYSRLYILAKDTNLILRIQSILEYRSHDVILHFSEDDLAMLSVPYNKNLDQIPVGFLNIPDYPKKIIPYFMEDYYRTPKEVELTSEDLYNYNIDSVAIYRNRMPHDTKARDLFINWLTQRALMVGIDEFSSKDDFRDLIDEEIGIFRYYLRHHHRFTEEFLISTRDRNTRLTIFRTSPEDGLLEFWESVIEENKRFGFKPGSIYPISTNSLYKIYNPIIILGTIAAILVFLERFYAIPLKGYILIIPLVVAIAGWLAKGIILEGIAFITALIFPILSIKYMMTGDVVSKNLLIAFKRFITAMAITLLGGLFLHGILGDISYIAGISQFRGIKAFYAAGYVVLFFLIFEDEKGNIVEKLNLKRYSIKDILLMALGLAAFYLLWNRTGNESVIPIPKIELQLRAFLENIMWVRPRTKEFLLGHPAALLFLMTDKNSRFRTFLIITATLGQLSVINTFAHIHIPFYISMIRTLGGVALGLSLSLMVLYLKKGIEGKYYNG